METKDYTTPVIKKGKEIDNIPKGSNKLKEQAKQPWYIEYYFKGKQIRVRPSSLNRIKDPIEKQNKVDLELATLKLQLEKGYNPNNPTEYIEQEFKKTISLEQAIKVFLDYHKKYQSRLSTIQSYSSKLNHLLEMFPNKQLGDLKTNDLETFVLSKIESNQYTNVSVKIAKKIFKTFFTVLTEQGYYHSDSPMLNFDKKIKSFKTVEENHIPYTLEDAKLIMDYLKENDYYSYLFCNIIYETCLRPSEIKGLKIKDINLNENTITVLPDVKKVTTQISKDIIPITPRLKDLLTSLELENKPREYFLMGSYETITHDKRIGKNIPYNRLINAFKKIDKISLEANPNLKESELLQNKRYDLYSWKHFSNIQKYKSGWLPEQIMKANRHSNIMQTLKYLKNLKNETDISNLTMPEI